MIRRVRDRATFEALARARRRNCGPVTLRFLSDGTADPPRVAYAIGRWAGGAVDRNRLRRRLRAAVQRCAGDLMPGGVYLFGADASGARVPFDELQRAVERLVASRAATP